MKLLSLLLVFFTNYLAADAQSPSFPERFIEDVVDLATTTATYNDQGKIEILEVSKDDEIKNYYFTYKESEIIQQFPLGCNQLNQIGLNRLLS
jgi:hypothetical protein